MAMSLTDEDKRWIDQRLEVMEMRLLSEFHKWATSVESRQRNDVLQALVKELSSVKDWVKKLEGR